MMLSSKASADMGRIKDYLNTQPTAKLEIEVDISVPVAWSITIYDPKDYNNPFSIFAAQATTFDEALAKLSKLVYEEQLKTKG